MRFVLKHCGEKERAMTITTAVRASILIAALGFACLLPARVYAQVDAMPDTNVDEGPNMERIGAQTTPVAAAKEAKIDFAGSFRLPYGIKCGTKNLKPGQYSLAVKSAGTSRVVTIHGRDTNVNLPVHVVSADRSASHSTLLVRNSGEARQLEGVYVEELKATLYVEANIGYGVMEQLPIS
jgi:hypothetical protein